MYYLKFLLKENKINISCMSRDLGIPMSQRLGLFSDFKLEELQKIKQYLVNKKIILSDFDIGVFLDII